jgi:hypothetical protein
LGLSTNDLQKEERKPSSADGTTLKVVGRISLRVKFGRFFTTEPFFVVDKLRRPILSRKCLKRLHLIPQNFPNEIVSETTVNSVESAVHVKTGYPDLDALVVEIRMIFAALLRKIMRIFFFKF